MSLQIGDPIPAFSLQADNGDTITQAELLGQGPFVVYFYPFDNTPGCTAEACTFRDQYEAFTDLGASVYGVSGDSIEKHVNFKERYRLPFTLLSDPGRQITKAFGVKKRIGILPGRVTFVFDSAGILRHRFKSDTNMERHVTESLAAIKRLLDEGA